MSDQIQLIQISLDDNNSINKLHPVYITNGDFPRLDTTDFFYIRIMDYINVEYTMTSVKSMFTTALDEVKNIKLKLDKKDKSLRIIHEVSFTLPTNSLLHNYTIKELKLLLTDGQYELLEKHLGKNDGITKMIMNTILDLYVIQVSRTLRENVTYSDNNFGIPIGDVTRKYNQYRTDNELMNNSIRSQHGYNNSKSYSYKFDYIIIPYKEGIDITKPEEMLQILNRQPLVG